MAAVSTLLPGWTIAEAIERTSDPDQLADYETAGADGQKAALWDRLSRGELVAEGCFDTPTAPPTPIDPNSFPALDWSGPPSTTLFGGAGSKVQIFDVRLFPVLGAPNIVNYLNGASLAEVFQKYVISDPEVEALAKRLLKFEPRHSDVFLKGHAPGPFTDFHWPLDLTASQIAFQFISSPISFIGDVFPEPSVALLAVSEVLASRIAQLREVLATGKLVAFGTFVRTGVEVAINRLEWTRKNLSIDVSNGDLCEGQGHPAVAKWTGLSFQLPHVPLLSDKKPSGLAPKTVEVPGKAKSQVRAMAKFRSECGVWLESMMRASPDIRKFSRDELWVQAQEKWPKGLSWRQFEAARAEAIKNAEALAWAEAGRPKGKSPHP